MEYLKKENLITNDTSVFNKPGIYCILSKIDDKIYIGSSRSVYNRIYMHTWRLSKGSHDNEYLQNSFNKYGRSNFAFYLLEFCEENLLINREKFWFDKTKCFDRRYGFNLVVDPVKHSHSEETKKKIGIASKSRKASKETRYKQRIAKLGKKQKQESINKMIAKQKGSKKFWSESSKKSYREKRINYYRSTQKPFICLQNNKTYKCTSDAAQDLGLKTDSIYSCLKGRIKITGGYSFKFVEGNIQ